MDIISAVNDKRLLKPAFKDLKTWRSWLTLLAVFFGLPVDKNTRPLAEACTGRKRFPKRGFTELVVVAGRRSGKSFIAAVVAVYLALFHDYKPYLGPGERATILVVAADRPQARTVFGDISGILNNQPVFAASIDREYKERIILTTRVDIKL